MDFGPSKPILTDTNGKLRTNTKEKLKGLQLASWCCLEAVIKQSTHFLSGKCPTQFSAVMVIERKL